MAFINKVINKEKKIFWVVFVIIAAVLLVVLFASAERPLGQAGDIPDSFRGINCKCIYPDGSTNNPTGKRWFCSLYCVKNGDPFGFGSDSGGVGVGSDSGGIGGGISEVIRPGPFNRSFDGEVLSEEDWNRIADFEGEYDNYYLDLVADNQNISKGDLVVGGSLKEPDRRCVHDCLQSKLGTEVECNRKCSGISDNDGTRGGDTAGRGPGGGNDKNGLGCDVMRRCPDGKSFYGQKDPVTGNCTTIDSCPKRGGGGGSGGDGLVCAQVMPPKPRCGFGEVATFYGQTDKECAKWVCEKISPPLPNPDDCLPNSKSIKCIFWRIFG